MHAHNRYGVKLDMPPWPPDFRRDAVKKVLDGGMPTAAVARELGVPAGTLQRWVRDHHVRSMTEGRGVQTTPRFSASGRRLPFELPAWVHAPLLHELVRLTVMVLGGVAMVALALDISEHTTRADLWIPLAIACGAELGWLSADILCARKERDERSGLHGSIPRSTPAQAPRRPPSRA